MSCGGCLHVADPALQKTLQSGEVVCNACPGWRLECECRAIIEMPDVERKAHYFGVAKARGQDAANELVSAVNSYRSAAREKQIRK